MNPAIVTELHAPTASPIGADAHELVWEVAEAGVWAAVEPGPVRAMYAGFVHHVGDRYLAVDGLGTGIGAFDHLVVAQSAVALAFRTTVVPSVWMREA